MVLLLAEMLIGVGVAHADETTVQAGDTLTALAATHGVSVAELVRLNDIANPNLIFIGQRIILPGRQAVKGLAMAMPEKQEDLAALGAVWWYVWGWCDAVNCVPMVRSMELPPSCPVYLLVGNEPNAVEPWGAPMAPSDAVDRVLAIESMCPGTRQVVGNVSADDWSGHGGWGNGRDWLKVFLREYRSRTGHIYAGALGVHCYSAGTADYCLSRLKEMRTLTRGEMWMTESNCLSCSTTEFKRLLDYAGRRFARLAVYTNRQPPEAYRDGWALLGADLVNTDGTLTPNGQVYTGW